MKIPACAKSVVLAVAFLLAAPAHAQPEPQLSSARAAYATASASARKQAAALASRATERYRKGEHAEAADLYRKAYAAVPAPELLFNLAQCQRQLGDVSRAVALYERYLQSRPDAPERAQVERWLAEQRARSLPAAQATDHPGVAPRRVAAQAITRTAVTAGATQHGPAPVAPGSAAGPETDDEASALYERWWFWAAVGVAAAGTVAVLVANSGAEHEPPRPGSLGTVQWQ